MPAMKTWYTIKAQAADAPVEVSIFDEIGFWGVTGAMFIQDLKSKVTQDTKQVNLAINSPGGSVFDGWAMFNYLNSLKAKGVKIVVDVVGIAASMASVVAMAGDERRMPENAMVMVHNAISGVWGDAEDLRDVADTLDKIDAAIVGVYASATGKDHDTMRGLMAADTFMTAAEALDLGFATEVVKPVQAVACFDLERLPENVKAVFTKAAVTKPSAPVASFVSKVAEVAKAAGMEAYVDLWAADDSLMTVEAVQAQVADAVEVRDLCVLLKFSAEDTAGHIRARRGFAATRKVIAEARAAEDVRNRVDSTRPATEVVTPKGKTDDFNPTAIWASINERNKRST